MNWLHPLRQAGQERIRLIAREAELAARLATAETDLAQMRCEAAELRHKLERLLDNALFAAGVGPIFAPEDARFRARPLDEQIGLTRLRQPSTAAEWRRRAEQETWELAREKERKQWQQDLEQVKQQARQDGIQAPPSAASQPNQPTAS